MSANPLVRLFDVDLNSERTRAIVRFLFGQAGSAIARVFPARAAACYSGLVLGFALSFVPIAKHAPARLTLMLTLAGAGLVAVSAHELDELQDDIDEAKQQKERDRQLRLFADAEAKNKVAETNLLLHGYELDKSLPPELQQTVVPVSDEENATAPPADRAAFDAAIALAAIVHPGINLFADGGVNHINGDGDVIHVEALDFLHMVGQHQAICGEAQLDVGSLFSNQFKGAEGFFGVRQRVTRPSDAQHGHLGDFAGNH